MSHDPSQPDHAEEDLADLIDNTVPTRGYQMLPVVGLGGSAGSIAALLSFFAAVPADTGLAFVVVLHLSPEHKSSLAELLQRSTAMTVLQVRQTEPVRPDTVYVIPPGKGLQTMDGQIRLFDLPLDRTRGHATVDHFFRTLADTHGPHASAIVLSGLDGDGAIGIKRIKERGGLTIAQDPGEAEYDSMPMSAIGTSMVDWVLPVAEMPARLLEYHRQERRLRLPPEDGPLAPAKPPGAETEGAGSGADRDEAMLAEILAFLRTRGGRDCSNYRRATVLRRIGRRMQVNGVDDLAAYLDCLRTRPGEAGALLQDLLVSVTNFFRDSDCFRALEARLPELFHGKGPGDAVRAWVVACATGEEAYSVAMLLVEHARTLEAPPVIQVFATDLDEGAIRLAREGVYPLTIEADVSEARLRRFFIKEARGYRVRRELRETVLFAIHDLITDSPFSRLDLLSCRNLLIYLNREAQRRAQDIFHFSLRQAGLIFLGASESTDEGSPLFETVDKKHRLFRKKSSARRALPTPSEPGTLALAKQAQQSRAEGVGFAGRGFEQPGSGFVRSLERPAADQRPLPWGEVHLRLLDQLAPPSVLVDADFDIVHLSPAACRFMVFHGGEPSSKLLRSIHPGLRIELPAALHHARQTHTSAWVPAIPLDLGSETVDVVMRVDPSPDLAADLMLVSFLVGPQAAGAPRTGVDERAAPALPMLLQQPDQEVERLRSRLRETIEQYEVSTEELKAGNEELQAMNEELRSATEELETSREELQSINEELITVNQELKSKVDELGQANSDMANLIDATAIATVFLDRELRITRYTPTAVAPFKLIPSDLGRPLTDMAMRLDYPELAEDARHVLDKLATIEREVGERHEAGKDGEGWYLARLRPYRTIDDRIAGVVLSLVDIRELKQAQEALLDADARFRAIVNQATVGVVQLDLLGCITFANGRMAELLGYSEAELIGRDVEDLILPADLERHRKCMSRLVNEHQSFEIEKRLCRSDGHCVWVHNSVTWLPDSQGGTASTIAVCVDITERKQTEAALRRSEEHLRMVIENAREYAIFTTDIERRITGWNPGAERILGYAEAEAIDRFADMIFTPEDQQAGVPAREAQTALAEGRSSDDRFHQRKDGSRLWASGVLMSMHDITGQIVGFVKILRDQTEARRIQQALEHSQTELLRALAENETARVALESANVAKDQFLAILSHELRTPLTPAVMALQLLGRRKDLPGDVTAALELIHRNIRIESHLIDDLLDLTRISRGTLEIAHAPVDLHQIIHSAVEICEPDLHAKQQRLTLALAASESHMHGDVHRLQQVVWNLLKNASKFTPPNGEIRLRSFNEDGCFVMALNDDGIGIDADVLARIFEPFVQGGSWVAREFGGLGLGLSISKATVHAHGGSMQAESEGRGRGATFTVRLPLADRETP